MTVVWPDDLPCWALPESVVGSLADGLLRTQPDTGPAKVRLLSSAVSIPVSAQLVCDGTKLARLQRFYYEEIARGAAPFFYRDQFFDQRQLSDPDTGAVLTDPETGAILLNESWWLVGFVSAPVFQSVGRRAFYRVSLSLEILP